MQDLVKKNTHVRTRQQLYFQFIMNVTVSSELANELMPNAVDTASWQLYLLGKMRPPDPRKFSYSVLDNSPFINNCHINIYVLMCFILGFEYVIIASLSIAEFIRRIRHPKFSMLSSKVRLYYIK